MKKCILLIRVSTKKQDYEDQTKELIDYAKRDGYQKSEMELIRNKESGEKLEDEEREGLNQMYQTIENEQNTINCVYIWELNRLSRRTSTLYKVKEYLTKRCIQLAIKEPIPIRLLDENKKVTSGAEILFANFAAWSKLENDSRIERFNRAKDGKAERFEFLGGDNRKILFGYKVNELKQFEKHPVNSRIVERIFELYQTGKYGQRMLYKKLIEEGISVKLGTITKILSHEEYTGKVIDNTASGKAVYAHKYPQIISEELYNRCREIAKTLNLGSGMRSDKQNFSKNVHYANRIVKCGCCGHYLYVRPIHKKYIYYCGYHSPYSQSDKYCEAGINIPTKIIDSLALWCAYKEEQHEIISDRTKTIEHKIIENKELQEKINSADQQFKIIQDAKRKELKKVLKSATDETLNQLVKEETKNERERINKDMVTYREQIKRNEDYINNSQTLTDKKFKNIIEVSTLKLPKNNEIPYFILSEQERYDFVHRYIDEIICRKIENNGVKIEIKTYREPHGENVKTIFHYYGHRKNKDKRIICYQIIQNNYIRTILVPYYYIISDK